MKKNLCILITLLFLCSCAPAQYKPAEPFQVKFEPMSPYTIDLSIIPKPDKIKPLYVDKEFKEVEKELAKYVLLIPEEYAKVAGLLKLAKAYKEIILAQEKLVNANIDIMNSLKEYSTLEQAKTKQYRDLWVDSENSYRQERYHSQVQETMFKWTLGFFGVAGVVIAILALL